MSEPKREEREMDKGKRIPVETREVLARLERLHAAGAIDEEERDRRKVAVLRALRAGAARLGLAIALACALSAALGVGVSRAGQTYYAAPTGSGIECAEAAPCEFDEAYSKAGDGDSVVLEPGTYTLGEALAFGHSISLGGEPGRAAQTVIKTTTFKDVFTLPGAHPELHDLKLEGSGSLVLSSGGADRIIVAYTGAEAACALVGGAIPTTLRDSVCWAHGASGAAAILASIGAGDGSVGLGHVTAVSSTAGGEGLHATAAAGSHLGVQVANSVIEGDGVDVEAVGPPGSQTSVALTHSNWDSDLVQDPSTAAITPVAGSGDQTAAPRFVAVAEADFREAPGSPTIDAGSVTPSDGPLALGGEARALGECGAPATPDIGAYEVVPAGCPPPPAEEGHPKVPVETPAGGGDPAGAGDSAGSAGAGGSTPSEPAAAIRVVKVERKRRTGGVDLLVEVPGAGRLTLSGKGVKTAKATASGPGEVRIPVHAGGATRRLLDRSGRATVHLSIAFTGADGRTASTARTLRLEHRRRHREAPASPRVAEFVQEDIRAATRGEESA
jgi:hypothetical protein